MTVDGMVVSDVILKLKCSVSRTLKPWPDYSSLKRSLR